MFLFARILPLVRISVKLDHIWGVRTKKPPKKGCFTDDESVLKTLKIYNLTITNAILIKLTTIMHLHETVNKKRLRARNSVFWLNFKEFLDYLKKKSQMLCITSHCFNGKIFVQIGLDVGGHSMKNHQK